MDFVRDLLQREPGRDHLRVFARFRLALGSLLAARCARCGGIAVPLDWGER